MTVLSQTRNIRQTVWTIAIGLFFHHFVFAMQCNDSNLGIRTELRDQTSDAVLSCVSAGTSYRLSVIGPTPNHSYCLNDTFGFSMLSRCHDATYGDLLHTGTPGAFRTTTNQLIGIGGFAGSIEPNGCPTNQFVFNYPACNEAIGCASVSSDVLAWWKFDEESGIHAFDTANGNHGSLVNGPLRTGGTPAGVLEFDGSNDYVLVPDDSSMTIRGDFSIEGWIRTSDGYGTIVSKRKQQPNLYSRGFDLRISGTKLVFAMTDSNNNAIVASSGQSPSLNDLQWHHVAATIKRSSPAIGQLYIDGNMVHQFNNPPLGPLRDLGDLTIAGRADGDNFDGQIGDLAIHAKALSSNEIRSIYNASQRGKCISPNPTYPQLNVVVRCMQDNSNGTPSQYVACRAVASGGSGNYSYQWRHTGNGFFIPNGESADVFSCAGTQTVTATVQDGQNVRSDSTTVQCGF